MRIQVISDVHVEFHGDAGLAFSQRLDPTDVDVLCVVGDYAVDRGPMLLNALAHLCARFPQVVYITGNHEYYGSSRASVADKLADFDAKVGHFHWLENRAVEIDGQRFLGCTLWFPERADGMNPVLGRFLSDFKQIKGFSEWVYGANAASEAWLAESVRPGDVVLTHHIPDEQGSHPKFAGDPLNRFFVSQQPASVLSRAAYWFFGHTHESMAFQIGDTQFRSNPYGYQPNEINPDFDWRLIVER